MAKDALASFHPLVAEWFEGALGAPSPVQALAWPVIGRGEHALVLSPTGSGKTLAAFLACLDRLVFGPVAEARARCRVVYVSPLKALAVDVERNLRVPLEGLVALARARGVPHHVPEIAVRTGDTPARDRARFGRRPADLLITTPESLYLVLGAAARASLAGVDTVIVDEIHALVPQKRGSHLALSLERLDRVAAARVQRIGLSATQRPLDEVARFLGGAARPAEDRGQDATGALPEDFAHPNASIDWRPVTIVDAGARRPIELTLEVPEVPPEVEAPAAGSASTWAAIHPRLVELIRAHTSTLVFVNNRRTAEKLAGALNELAGEPLVRAHHGSLARDQRHAIEEALKRGQLRGLCATSSLELGIDMGAIDLVVQIEAPPSVASGLQRVGRAGHRLDAVSRGVVMPKHRGDLLAATAVVRAMRAGEVESVHFPRGPLDVLAQQVVAMVATEDWPVNALFAAVRGAAPYAALSRRMFERVLDMLSGRHASDELADLRPRLTWDRARGVLSAREGARRLAVVSGGTIPDRGLYGVFLAGAETPTRVGELDEEMVFESRAGEVFVLGASSWRIEQITHDRVLVSPAPGEPGKMPFWRGEQLARPVELGRAIGRLTRELLAQPRTAAIELLRRRDGLSARAAESLVGYLREQRETAHAVPDDRRLVVERCPNELGDTRMCLLTPLGGQVLAPWALALRAKVRGETGLEIEIMWANDGLVARFPERDRPPEPSLLFPRADEVEALVSAELGGSSVFAARFREAAGRALLLPRRAPGSRTPLWMQRKRAGDLLAVAARHGSFPIVLEAYRECLRDVFDLPSLVETLRAIEAGELEVVPIDTRTPSPFARGLLFGYVASYLYDGDAPLAERRAQALTVDASELRELLGEAELRELLDPEAMEEVERELQRLVPGRKARGVDGVHDLLLGVGELDEAEVSARVEPGLEVRGALGALVAAGRVLPLHLGGAERFVAVEDAARLRDALGVPLPALPAALLEPLADALGDVVSRYARTHAPFCADEAAARWGLPVAPIEAALHRLASQGRVMEGAFRPGGTRREWCAPDVLRTIRRRSLARLRHEVEPAPPEAFSRALLAWQGVTQRRPGPDAVLDAIEKLQGLPIVASALERDVLSARVEGYLPGDLEGLCAAGEVVWIGVERLGERDGRVALYLADHLARLHRPPPTEGPAAPELDERERRIVAALGAHGASFFPALHEAAGAGYPQATLEALWSLVWKGLVTNDGLRPLRAYVGRSGGGDRERRIASGRPFRSRRVGAPEADGRWSLVRDRAGAPSDTELATSLARQLLSRYGLVTREVAAAEQLPGGFSAVYEVLRRMEEAGQARRGYFVADVGAMQFALPAAIELLRALREPPAATEVLLLAATDPACAYGALVPWPACVGRAPSRSAGAYVVLVSGRLVAWISKGGTTLATFLPEDAAERAVAASAIADRLAFLARARPGRHGGVMLGEIDGAAPAGHPLWPALRTAGFTLSSRGLSYRGQEA